MKYSVRQITDKIGGEIVGDEMTLITQPSKIEEATSGSITFYNNEKYLKYLDGCKASAILVSKNEALDYKQDISYILVDNVYAVLPIVLSMFQQNNQDLQGIHETAIVAKTAQIGASTYIGPHTIIEEGAIIGDNTIIYGQVFIAKNATVGAQNIIYPGVKIYYNCNVGNGCILHSNAVIGSDGFGFAPTSNGQFSKIPQVGNVVIEDQVEIGANCAIDRASIGSTIIRKGVKLDNLIHVAHNVEIGENTVIAAQTGIAGSTKIGPSCMIGGQVGVVGHLNIAQGTKIQAQSGMIKSVKQDNTSWYGSPAIEYNKYLRAFSGFKNLPTTLEEIRSLKKRIEELEQRKDQ